MKFFCSRTFVALWLLFTLCPRATFADVCDARGAIDPDVARVLTLLAKRLQYDGPPSWTLPDANAFAQRYLLRPRGAERLSAESAAHFANVFVRLGAADVQEIQGALAAAGFTQAVPPAAQHYDVILINGSTAMSLRRRIHEVARRVQDGSLHIDAATQVLMLDGERPLYSSETPTVLLDPAPFAKEAGWRPPSVLPRDECAMSEMIWQQMWLPHALRSHGVTFVHASKKNGANRAETADCIEAWVRHLQPQSKTALVVSNNPFVEYQRRVTEVVLRRLGVTDIALDAMGPGAELSGLEPSARLCVLLDAMAGALFRANEQLALGLM